MSPTPPNGREGLTPALRKAGAVDVRRAVRLVEELADTLPGLGESPEALLASLTEAASPDDALLGLVRLAEAEGMRAERLASTLTRSDSARLLVKVLGVSVALGDHLARHPEHVDDVLDPSLRDREAYGRRLVDAVSAAIDDGGVEAGSVALRVAYRRELCAIAAVDVDADDPCDVVDAVAAALADLAGAALEAALVLARAENPEAKARLCIIAMGKCGSRELNYLSDVDVIFVAEPFEGQNEQEALASATTLASSLMRHCSAATREGALWQVDAALRPEGKQGPLVRTVASHRSYYERWAKTWEFQALMKANPAAGDMEVGQAYLDAVMPLVWTAVERDDFVEDVQAMRRRVEDHVPPAEAARQVKLGRGGLRDVEFSVQLLQLVHGRTDPDLRVRSTLGGLEALRTEGYVARDDAGALDSAYRQLRVLEHRIQLHRLRRSHLLPVKEDDLRRLGRAAHLAPDPAAKVKETWQDVRKDVRRLHDRIFYRPLLAAVARLSSEEARLTQEGSQARLQALGFRDPAGAFRHLSALTEGVSRRAAIQRHVLPAMMGWLAEGVDPDAGLLAFRRISDDLGRTHWYMKMLRDESGAAEGLAHVLSGSRYAVELLLRAPQGVQLFGGVQNLRARTRDEVAEQMRQVARHAPDDEAVKAVREVRARELLRIAVARITGAMDQLASGQAQTDLTEATLDVALELAAASVEGGDSVHLALIGMGRLGGAEAALASDADVIAVCDPGEGQAASGTEVAAKVITTLRSLLSASGPDPALAVDLGLRPEGRNGPMVRTLDSCRTYYADWSSPWEAQALVRARPVAGDAEVGRQFIDLIDPLRYPADGLTPKALREMRVLKARMEAERLPRGADRRTHAKLGRGGLTDIEWTVQMLQLQHGAHHESLRTTSTLEALRAERAEGLLEPEDAETLRAAWVLASQVRDAGLLWRGRPVDEVPADARDLDGMNRLLGGEPGRGNDLHERYLKATRRARAVVERVFFG